MRVPAEAPVSGRARRTRTATLAGLLPSVVDAGPATNAAAALADAADRRTAELIAGHIAAAGAPPAPFCWMAVGSHARRELHAASDQDHALVWADEESATSPYARELAATVISGLTEFGMRPCTGGHMADRLSLGLLEWERLLHDHVAAPGADSAMDSDIMLDLRPIAGDLDIGPLTSVVTSSRDSPQLLRALAEAAVAYSVPGSKFGTKSGGKRTFNVKRHGLAPVVELARLHGLRARTDATGTYDRLAAAEAAGVLDAQLAGSLQFANHLLTRLRLQQQARALSQLAPLSDTIELDSLAWTDVDPLRRAFAAIRSAQAAVTVRM